jgi:SAM-dependent methyltransferase
MHQSSFDKMAEFSRDYLGSLQNKPLTVLDLGSCDYNGSYRALFDRPPWRYIGADLQAGPNVDLVLADAYSWRELSSESIDVLISGQTFEHTEFFWETSLEIARVLKPGGLCCLIAPAAGPEHRFPLDCWRIFADGFRAIARFAGLEVLFARTQWEELPDYDSESNKWHESILITRKQKERFTQRLRRRLYPHFRSWLRPLPGKVETLIQIFYSATGEHREHDSIIAGVEQGDWQKIIIRLPNGAAANPLRIDFMRTGDLIEISKLRVFTEASEYFVAADASGFDRIAVRGDAQRLPDDSLLRLKITGIDPQLHLPAIETPADGSLFVEMRLRVA